MVTGISGMSLLMEGSTIREGKYKDHQAPAIISCRNRGPTACSAIGSSGESGRYMY